MQSYFIYLLAKADKKNKSWSEMIKKLGRIDKNSLSAHMHYDLGFAYCKNKKWKEASQHLIEATKLKPTKISWKYRLAVALENSGNRKESNAIFDSIYSSNGNNEKKHFKSGILLLGYSRPIEAERSIRKAIELNKNNYKYHIALYMALKNQGNGKSWIALESLEEAARINTKSTEVFFNLGLNYEYMKNYHKAIYSYFKALSLNKKKSKKIFSTYIENLRSSLHKVDKKIAIEDSERYYNLGTNSLTESPVIAELNFKKAIEINADNPKFYVGLAQSLEKQGDSKLWQELEALKIAFNKGLKSASKFYRMGYICEKMNKFIQANASYNLAIENGLMSSEIFYRIGFCFKMIGDQVSSEQSFQQAIDNDSQLNSKRFGIGVFHNKFGRKQLAIEAFENQLSLYPNDAELLYKLGMAYDRAYRWQDAEKMYQKAVAHNSEIYEWQYRLGFVLERLGDFKEAALWYEKAAKGRDAHTPYWFFRLGYVKKMLSCYKEACEAFIKTYQLLDPVAITFKEQDCQAVKFYKQAVTYESEGQFEFAENFYQQAIDTREGTAEYLYYRLGCIAYKKHDYELACRYFVESRTLNTPHGTSDKQYYKNINVRKFSDYNYYFEKNRKLKNLIVYESFQGSSISCNPLALFLTIYNESTFSGFKHYWVINNIADVPDYIKEMNNVYFVLPQSDLYIELLATAKILINNSTFPAYFTKKEEQIYINTWHGTPIKTLGKDMKGRFLEHKNFTRNILQSDFLVSPNRFTSKILLNSHDVNNIYNGSLLESGYPRIDLTLSINEYRKKHIKLQLKLSDDKNVIFYAPTWRGTHGNIDINKDKLVSDLEQLATIPNSMIMFRGHSLLEEKIGKIIIPGVMTVPKDIDTNELLSFTDILITDYSSIFFDFFPTKKPIYYYTYDFEEYNESRGLYFNFEDLPGVETRNIDLLIKSISSDLKSKASLKNHARLDSLNLNNYDDKNASKRVVSALIDKINAVKAVDNKNKKQGKSFLFYTGPFMRNGITTSFINLANKLISLGHSVSVVVDANAVAKHDDRLEQIAKLNKKVNLIGRVGGMVFSLEERFIHGEFNRDYSLATKEMRTIWDTSWRKEFKRIFGNAKFDCIINFEGYTQFWASLFSVQQNISRNIYQHNDMFSEYNEKYPYLAGIFNMYKNYDRVISVSEETRNLNLKNIKKLISIGNENENEKFIYSENLLNTDTIFSMAQNDIEGCDKHIFNTKGKVFINIGRLSIEKDHAKLIRAFKKANDTFKDSRLIILGDGPLKSDIAKLVSELNLDHSVFLLGHRLNPYCYLSKSDCFVLSSNHEGQPMTLLEALILQKDIIATSIAGNNSVMRLVEETGVENSLDGLSEALMNYIKNGKLQKTFDYENYQDMAIDSFLRKI